MDSYDNNEYMLPTVKFSHEQKTTATILPPLAGGTISFAKRLK